MVWAIALVVWGQLSWLHPPPQPPVHPQQVGIQAFTFSQLAPPVYLQVQQLAGSSSVQQQVTHWCVINTGLGTNSKRSTIQAPVNKMKNLCQPDPLWHHK